MASNFRHLAEELRREIENELHQAGMLCRVFARGKDARSLQSKIEKQRGKYSVGGKLIQDAIGVRAVLYFSEDIDLARTLVSRKFDEDLASSTIDKPKNDQFAVTRFNLVYRLASPLLAQMQEEIGDAPLDTTFELQLRSVLSEGWHEVEHDLRYKVKDYWIGHDDLSRALNGVMATLETAEWSMTRQLDLLAHRHYKAKAWLPMLHTKLRMRARPEIAPALLACFERNERLTKSLFRIDRNKAIETFSMLIPKIPVTLGNVVYVWNASQLRDESVLAITPETILNAVSSLGPRR